MKRLSIALLTALALAGCGGGGSSGSGAAPNPAGRIPAAMSLSLGAATAVGGLTVFALTVSAADSSGSPIVGTFASPITLTTSNPTDTGFSSSATGSPRAGFADVSSSTQPVYFVYDGATLATAVTITESSPTVAQRTFGFQSTSQTTSAAIASLSLAANGAIPLSGSAGSFTLTAAAYSSTGALITGTYPTPIVLTTNDSTDLTLSIAGGTPASSISITSPAQIVVVSYDGLAVPSGTNISASASGASTVSIPFVPSSATAGGSSVASIALAQVGALPNAGTAGQFALVLTASNASGGAISGTYPQPIVVSSNDSKDLTFSTVAAGPFAASVSVPNSSTVVYVAYDGLTIPANTKFSASAGAVVGTLAFNPAATVTAAPYVATLYITTAGAPPEQGTVANPIYGSQPIYMSAYDQFTTPLVGPPLTGTYPTAIRMTVNNVTDLQLTIGSYSAATQCELLSPGTPCPNVAQEVINGSGQAIFADYVDAGPVIAGTPPTGGGALEAPHPDISITTDILPGAPNNPNNPPCAVIQFPLSGAGSTTYVCQDPNPTAAKLSRKSAAKTWQLVPITASKNR